MATIGNGKRSYFLVIAKGVNWAIKITDNNRDYEVLAEIKADSYDEATKMVTFIKTINGEMKFL